MHIAKGSLYHDGETTVGDEYCNDDLHMEIDDLMLQACQAQVEGRRARLFERTMQARPCGN